MRKYLIAACALLSFASASLGNNDNNAFNAGATQSRNSGGLTLDGALGNPALVGLERRPLGGLSLMPTSVAFWSDKIAPPFGSGYLLINPFGTLRDPEYYVSAFFKESFGLSNELSPEEVSTVLTEKLRGGFSVYAGMQTSPIVVATRGFGLNIKTYADVDVTIPDGFLLPLFSETDGIIAGRTLNFSDLRANAIWATEVAFKLGYSTTVPFMRDYLKLDKGAAGVGMKLVLGHSYFNAEIDKNSAFSYDSAENKYKIDNAKLNVVTAGTGIYGNYRYNSALLIDNPINGQGFGLDLGTVFHNSRHAISADVQDIGMIVWNGKQVHKTALDLSSEFDLYELGGNFGKFFGIDTLTPTGKNDVTWLPAALNLGYTYNLDFAGSDFHVLLGYLTASLNYNQQLVLGPGKNTYTPRVSAGGTLGLLAGYLPIRYGLIAGGPEQLASAVGIGLDAKYISIDASYKAVGSPILITTKGFECAAGLTFRWGFRRIRDYVKDKQEERVVPEPPTPEVAPPETPPLPALEESVTSTPKEVVYTPIEINMTMLPPPPQPTVEEAKTLQTSQRAINFRTGSAELTPESYGPLETIANLLKHYPHTRYEIQGHTDSQGNDVYNLLLSAERAAAVKYYLLSRGAPQECLIAIGYGKNMPIAYNNTAEGRAQNRRVEFVQILSQDQYDMLKIVETEMARSLTERVLQGQRR